MKLRTEVEVKPFPFEINHQDKVMLMGSCFTQNISKKLRESGFDTLENPYGITFNPLSICKQIKEIIEHKKYLDHDITEKDGHFFSFQHHSSFNRTHFYDLLVDINENITQARAFLKKAKVLFISLGTSWVWGHLEKNCIVNNCHKIPAKEFELLLGEAVDIEGEFNDVFDLLRTFNPNLQLVFTVSPVRHMRSGAIENSRSKSVLISAIHELVDEFRNGHYFPSYEILIDDLRDYRFYKDDLLHPSEKAVDYIWKKFGDGFFNSQTLKANVDIGKVKAMQEHRPFNPESEDYKKFLQKIESRKINIEKEHGVSMS